MFCMALKISAIFGDGTYFECHLHNNGVEIHLFPMARLMPNDSVRQFKPSTDLLLGEM